MLFRSLLPFTSEDGFPTAQGAQRCWAVCVRRVYVVEPANAPHAACILSLVLCWGLEIKKYIYRSFIVSGLTFRSLIHFEFIFVYGVGKCSSFIFLQVVDQFSQHHLLMRLSFLHCIFLFKNNSRDFPGGPGVKTSPSTAGDAGSIPGQGARIPHGLWPKNQSRKQP